MSSTRQQRQRFASPAPPGESDSNINVTQRGEFTYLEIKKMYSCPAKCGTESNDKSHMLRHIWVDHREEDGLNLMKQFQIDSGAKSVIPYKCYGCDKQPVFRPSALFSHFLEHINEAEDYTERLANEVLEEINAKNLTQKQKTTSKIEARASRSARTVQIGAISSSFPWLHCWLIYCTSYSTSTLVLIRSIHSPRPSSATPLAKNYTLSRCWVQRVFSNSRRSRGSS